MTIGSRKSVCGATFTDGHHFPTVVLSSLSRLKAATSRAHLASILGIKLQDLTYLLYKKPIYKKYTSFEIPKRSGGKRKISAPIDSLKSLQRKVAEVLQECISEIETSTKKINRAAHGFRLDKSILTNAAMHRNKRYVFNIDLEDFFPSITFPRIRGFLTSDKNFNLAPVVATTIAQIACLESKLPQGSPCSPVISNLIAGILDVHLSRLAKVNGCTYTRYADDITFSTNKKDFPIAIAIESQGNANVWVLGRQLAGLIKKSGFSVNVSKTRMQYRTSRQQVTGLVVNKKISAPNEYRHQVRAYVNSLVRRGFYMVDNGEKVEEGGIQKLHGMLGFIHAVESVYRTDLQRQPYNYPGVVIDERRPTGNLSIYRRFLLYTRFYANHQPLLICEGKTDNVYIGNAIHQRKSEFPLLIKKNDDGKDVISFQFFKYARKHRRKSDIYLPNYSTAMILGNGSGGGPNLAGLMSAYRSELKKFTSPGGKCPVIFIVDSDSGGKPVFKVIEGITKKKPSGTELFIHVFENVYVIPISKDGKSNVSIEHLFSENDKSILMDGKPFDFSGESSDSILGKASFAYDFVAKYPEKIDWSGFSRLLKSISDILELHKA
ncbi:retron Ec67 family RNA-directed DNA polymerase/endonuclease [Paracidovorax cattleyae]|nr:retron Ec67 family RNA-directed DNA polymerase/endonuclease [Paracidovorax cattleyae]